MLEWRDQRSHNFGGVLFPTNLIFKTRSLSVVHNKTKHLHFAACHTMGDYGGLAYIYCSVGEPRFFGEFITAYYSSLHPTLPKIVLL